MNRVTRILKHGPPHAGDAVDGKHEATDSLTCAAHPDVATLLRCAQCDRPICPRCTVMTPGGQKCRDCARLRRLPMYEVRPRQLVVATAAALGLGVAAGLVWALIPPFLGLFMFLIAAGLGYAVGAALDRAAGGKRGRAVQYIAAAGIVVAYVVRNMLLRGAPLIVGDIFGYIAVAIAIFVAAGRLR